MEKHRFGKPALPEDGILVQQDSTAGRRTIHSFEKLKNVTCKPQMPQQVMACNVGQLASLMLTRKSKTPPATKTLFHHRRPPPPPSHTRHVSLTHQSYLPSRVRVDYRSVYPVSRDGMIGVSASPCANEHGNTRQCDNDGEIATTTATTTATHVPVWFRRKAGGF